MKKYTVVLGHNSSLPGRPRWCEAKGWAPANEIAGAEYVDGAWWTDVENVAGLVCFADAGDEGDVVEVDADDLRVAACGDCRVLGPVEVGAECLYCGRDSDLDATPAVDDDAAWGALARDHAADCEWVVTRAHRRDLPVDA
jgi:hypothetical protein